MQRLGAVLVAAALALTGCIGAMAQGTPAMEHKGQADEQAYADDETAELVSVSGFEINESQEDGERSSNHWSGNLTVEDDRIGDGGPPLWVYEYRTANGSMEVIVAENGTVMHVEHEDDVDEDDAAIEDWEVTSIEAVEIIQDNNATWEIHDEGMAFYHLSQENETGDPIWSMGQIHDDGLVVAQVNATTGEFLGAHPVNLGWSWGGGWGGWSGNWGSGWGSGSGSSGAQDEPYQEGGSFSGTVSMAEPTTEHTFEINQRGHPEMGVALTLDDPAASTVTATVDGPDETLGTLEASTGEPGTDEWWDDPVWGEYTVTVELQDGATQDYKIQWCAEGEAYDMGDNPYGPDEVAPCDHVDGERGRG